jgi:phospholipid N-methyltransferase
MAFDEQIATTRGGDALLFARNFFRYPRMLGSMVPSSRFLIKKLLKEIDFAHARVIVEYGPGIGGITTEILRRMRPDAILIAIETNPQFVYRLRSLSGDDRLRIAEASAESVLEILRQQVTKRPAISYPASLSARCPRRSAIVSCVKRLLRSSREAPFLCISFRPGCWEIYEKPLVTCGASLNSSTYCLRICSSANARVVRRRVAQEVNI